MTSYICRNGCRMGVALMWVTALALSGCASVAPSGMPSSAAYEAAIADAAVASPRKVAALMPLPAADKVRVVS